MAGNFFAVIFAAIIGFAVLPGVETFEGFIVVMGLYLIPVGALEAQPWQTLIFFAMATNFLPLLNPANQMSYDPADFYNRALAIIAGNIAAVLSFRLLPPLSPALRTRRLLALMLRDLRRLATGLHLETSDSWERRAYGRLSVLPDEAAPLQRAQLLAILALGTEIVQLRRAAPLLGIGPDVDAALDALAYGNSTSAIAKLDRLDRGLATRSDHQSEAPLALRIRGSLLAMRETLMDHASYLDAGALA
jgi:uncharacterized membrane protein YccC